MTKINKIIMNRQNDLIHSSKGGWAVFGSVATKDLLHNLAEHGGDEIEIEFRTMDEYREKDLKTYSKRLQKLSELYEIGDFSAQVVEGYTHENTQICKIKRKNG